LLLKIVTAPVRLPWRGLKRLYRPVAERRRERRWRRQELAAAEQQRTRERERERKEAEALAAARRIIDVD
jgi:hypothetical protein